MTNLLKNILGWVAAAAVVAVPVALGTGAVNLTPQQEPLRIYSSPGGSVFEFIGEYNRIRTEGQKVELRGVCASACTFFLGMLPKEQVCYDKKVYLGFHGVYRGGFMTAPTFDPAMTKWTYEYVYTPEVIKELNKLGWSIEYDVDYTKNPTGLIWQGADFMKALGYKECDA